MVYLTFPSNINKKPIDFSSKKQHTKYEHPRFVYLFNINDNLVVEISPGAHLQTLRNKTLCSAGEETLRRTEYILHLSRHRDEKHSHKLKEIHYVDVAPPKDRNGYSS